MKATQRRRGAEPRPLAPTGPEFRDRLGGAPHSKLSQQLWLRLSSCASVVEKRVRARLEQEFATTLPRFEVLAAIERHPTGLTISQVSRAIMVSNGNVTAVANRLLEDGWIVRTVDSHDRRVATVRLTRKGRAAFARMANAQAEWIDRMFAELADGELDELMKRLGDLRRSVERSDV
jgi:DNA-binding MarR family transcriptional regulator